MIKRIELVWRMIGKISWVRDHLCQSKTSGNQKVLVMVMASGMVAHNVSTQLKQGKEGVVRFTE